MNTHDDVRGGGKVRFRAREKECSPLSFLMRAREHTIRRQSALRRGSSLKKISSTLKHFPFRSQN